ncbi:Crp/Fnr family transcriptional regulator [Nocardiopsis sp. EMB25]|uniref:Crp/Fnr family transcriptional regulator n=1 Tax=Nocardiopsis sp. EMB25 TaxID=2835867 RepID=UPI002283E7D8|nr:Crp/Fnr family transcriptional regulator [Nocardiopsis sp. EMB25]MCY9783133.1 Crp/Fnr family transcriptional regulator [Nocardiopsis sp. EMB25]
MNRHGFGGMVTDAQWSRLVSEAVRRPFTEGETLLHQGGTDSGVHLVLSGRTRVVSVQEDGTSVPLAFRTRGEVLGEGSLAGGERGATVTALGPTTTAFLTSHRFRRLLDDLGLETALWRSILMRQRESDQMVQRSLLPAERRLPAALVHLAGVLGEPTPPAITDGPGTVGEGSLLRISLAQRDIADFAGMSRTSVHLAYTRLKESGLIRTGRQYVAIRDLAALKALARGDDNA